MTRIWAYCLTILSILVMSAAVALPISMAAAPSANAAPVVLQNPLGAGYLVAGSNDSVTGVWISFKIPQITCNAANPEGQVVNFLAGIDSYNTSDFEYVGVQEYCQPGPNSPEYYAIDSAQYPLHIEGIIHVSLGDVISAAVTVSGGMFHYELTDVTTGKSGTDTSPTSGTALNAAECLVVYSGIPLSKFAPVSFGKASTHVANTCDARVNGAKHAIGKFGSPATVYDLVLVNPVTNDTLARPTHLTDGGSSFTVTWKAAS